MRALTLLALLLAPGAAGAAGAASRNYSVGSFERVRVDGPFRVDIRTCGSPNATVEADQALLDRIEIVPEGETLAVRYRVGQWNERGPSRRADAPVVVKLSTGAVRTLLVGPGAEVTLNRARGQRVDLSVIGAGVLTVAAAEADQLGATVIGAGTITLAGHAGRARLLMDGPGTIDAAALVANDLTVRLDGSGETRAAARYTAQVTDTGLGRVTVTGPAKCTVTAPAGGQVACGAAVP